MNMLQGIEMSFALYGVSAELLAAFEGLRETPGISGDKFRAKEIDALAQMIICRNYGKATLELSHLLSAIAQHDPIGTQQAWLNFFWIEEAITPKRFRDIFEDGADDSALSMSEAGLTLNLDKVSFTISPTRVGVLAALLEFIVFIEPSILQQEDSFYQTPSPQAIKSLASRMQALLYDYLNDHLQAAQQQRRFRHLWHWLTSYQADSEMNVTDEAVFDFWQESAQNNDDAMGFRRFRTVAENFIDFRIALQTVHTQQQANSALSLGYETEAGEISPDTLSEALESVSDVNLDLASLTKMPKFLTKQQSESLSPIMVDEVSIQALPLTLMRMVCFGDWQAMLVQALRNKNDTAIHASLNDNPMSYSDHQQAIAALQPIIDAARASGIQVLLELQDLLAPSLVLNDVDDETKQAVWQALQQSGFDVMTQDSVDLDALAQVIYENWAALLLQIPALNRYSQQLQKAFKANNRQGFKQLDDSTDTTAYIDGITLLDSVLNRCKHYISTVEKQLVGDMDEKYHADLSIYRSIFTELYGERT